MSNWLAMATVTGVLGARVKRHLTEAGLTFDVTASHPLDAETHGAFVHLYSVLPNPALRNATLPERAADGTVIVPPRLALDLYYQLTFVGASTGYDVERMAGAVMTGLHAHPWFAPAEIGDFVDAQPSGSVLTSSNLAEQVEEVRATPLSSDVEELSRLWGMSQRGYHRLSVPYRVSVVVLEPDLPGGPAAPVLDAAVTVHPMQGPRLESVSSSARPQALVQLGEELVLRGSNLRGDATVVLLGDERRAPDDASPNELRLDFDAGSGLRAGVHAVQVRHLLTLTGGGQRDAESSRSLPVALVPVVDSTATTVDIVTEGAPAVTVGHRVEITLAPLPEPGQKVVLTLSHTTAASRRTVEGGSVHGTAVRFETRPPLTSGDHLLRVSVDGAETLLDAGPGGFTGPVVSVP